MREARQRLLKNVGSNVLTLAIGVGVGLWQTPFLLAHFQSAYGNEAGVAALGQIGLLRAIVDYALLLTFALTWTINRFMAIQINRNDRDATNAYFSTALFSLAAASLVLFAAAGLISPYLPAWLRTPHQLRHQVSGLFLLMMLASCTNTLQSPFLSVPLAKHRFDLINVFKIAGFAAQVLVLVSCFSSVGPRLTGLGWAYVLKEMLILVCAVTVARSLLPFLRAGPTFCRLKALKDMAAMSFWSMIDRIGYLLYFSIDLLVINFLLGAVACGRYAPMTQLAFLLGLFAGAVVHVFWPIAYEQIARNRMDELVGQIQRTSKFMGLILALPIGLLCGLASPLLTVWLRGDEWSRYATLLVILIAPAALNFSVRHLFSLTHGMNRVRVPAMVTIAGGLLNIVLSIALAKYTPLGIYGVAVATGISLTLRNALFMPLYCAGILQRPKNTFYMGLLPGLLTATIVAFCGFGLSHIADLTSFVRLGLAGCGLAALHVIMSVLFLGRQEVRFLGSLVGRKEV